MQTCEELSEVIYFVAWNLKPQNDDFEKSEIKAKDYYHSCRRS